jgi:hypothetical protein
MDYGLILSSKALVHGPRGLMKRHIPLYLPALFGISPLVFNGICNRGLMISPRKHRSSFKSTPEPRSSRNQKLGSMISQVAVRWLPAETTPIFFETANSFDRPHGACARSSATGFLPLANSVSRYRSTGSSLRR